MGEREGGKERGERIRTESQRKRKRVGKVKGGRISNEERYLCESRMQGGTVAVSIRNTENIIFALKVAMKRHKIPRN